MLLPLRPGALSMVFVLLFGGAALASEGEIQIHDLVGGTTVQVSRGKGEITLRQGGNLHANDKFITGEKQCARLLFPDGSQVWVGSATSVLVNSSGSEVQLAYVYYGKVRVQVPKSEAAPSKIKFVIRTRSAVMGVRGTDFVVESEPEGKYQLHTLSGEVEAALTDEKLIEGGVSVKSGTSIAGQPNQPIPRPTPFNVKEYENELTRTEPEFAKFVQAPIVVAPPPPPTKVPAVTAPATSTNGVRQRIQQINQQHQNAIDQQSGM